MEGAGRGRGQMERSPHRFLVHMDGGGVPSSISRPRGGGGGYGQQSVFKVCSLPKVARGTKSF